MESLEMDGRRQAAAGEESRNDLLLEHAGELARHPGGEEEAGLADVERKAAGGADRIVDQHGVCGQRGFLAVVWRDYPAAPAKEILHPSPPLFVKDEIDAGRLGRDFLGQVVDPGPHASVD